MANQVNPSSQAKIFAALGDPTRRELFERLGKKPHGAGDLAQGLPVSRPAVSQHLKVLREAGLIHCERTGTRRIYSVNQKGVEIMRRYFDKFWDHALAAFKVAAEEKRKPS
jgi:DNA-binding transcriptional ArsR family regulator